MTILAKRYANVAAFALALAASGGAWAQAPVAGLATVTSSKGEAKVTAVDPGTRVVTIVTADGRTVTGKVGDRVQNLEQVKAGDIAVVTYEERTSFVLSEPGTKVPGAGEVMVSARAAKGQLPAAGLMRQSLANYTVVSTNTQANTITLVNAAGGEVRTFDIMDPTARAMLPRVKPGDFLTAIDRQTLIATIARKP